MKEGKSLVELAQELQRQAQAKRDFIADTKRVRLQQSPVTDEGTQKAAQLTIELPQGDETFDVTEHSHNQIAQRLDIPKKYYDRVRVDHPELYERTVNTFLHKESELRMVRTLDNHARAFLSNRYRTLDNAELAEAVLPVLGELRATVESCEVTQSHLYIQASLLHIETEVTPGDVVRSGIIISNSEIGAGSVQIQALIFRLVCSNGLILPDKSIKKNHVGRAHSATDEPFELFSEQTLQLSDAAFWHKVQDVTRATGNAAQFAANVSKLRDAKEDKIEVRPTEAVEVAQRKFSLTNSESGHVLEHLIRDRDYSRYGLLNAITRTAEDVKDYDRSIELEALGGQVLELSRRDWREIAIEGIG